MYSEKDLWDCLDTDEETFIDCMKYIQRQPECPPHKFEYNSITRWTTCLRCGKVIEYGDYSYEDERQDFEVYAFRR